MFGTLSILLIYFKTQMYGTNQIIEDIIQKLHL